MKKIKLNADDRSKIYNALYDKADFLNLSREKSTYILKHLKKILRDYVFTPQELEMYKNSSRILIYKTRIRIDLKALGFVCPGMNIATYPSAEVFRLGGDIPGYRKIQVQNSFNLFGILDLEDPIYIPVSYGNESHDDSSYFDTNCIEVGTEMLSRIPEDEINTLKNLLIDLCEVMYQKENFGVQLAALETVKTLKQLEALNKDWYKTMNDILEEENQENFKNKNKEEKGVIEQLKDLMSLIKSKELYTY